MPPISALKLTASHFDLSIRMLTYDCEQIPEIAARTAKILTQERVKRAQEKARKSPTKDSVLPEEEAGVDPPEDS